MRQDLRLHENVSAQIASAALRVDAATTPWTATALPYRRQNATLFVAAVELRMLLIAIHISLIGFRQIYNSVALP